jgi:hypothetical protein
MKNLQMLVATIMVVGCVTPQKPVVQFIPDTRRPELEPLPPNPRDEALEGAFVGEEWVEPLLKGHEAPKSGLLVSASRAARDILFRTRYDELRKLVEADRTVWSAQRAWYEERLRLSAEEIQRLQPTWWDQNKDVILFCAGVVLGVGATVGVVGVVTAR